jgi:hypothetical protein
VGGKIYQIAMKKEKLGHGRSHPQVSLAVFQEVILPDVKFAHSLAGHNFIRFAQGAPYFLGSPSRLKFRWRSLELS